ncbi:MAG: hypothetical protein Q9210_002837 [Variospora velana]
MADNEKIITGSTPGMEKEVLVQGRRRSVPGKIAKHANEADEALKAFAGHAEVSVELDEATSKRLLRKIDLHLMLAGIAPETPGLCQLTVHILGDFLAYGIAKGARLHGSSIAPWKIVFLATGLLTIAMGALFLAFMPDNQLNVRWLKPPDRRLAIERVRVNQQGIGNKHSKAHQMKEALLDPLAWAFAFYALAADIPNGGITNFFCQLIMSFSYTPEESLLSGTPSGTIEVFALILYSYLDDRYSNRLLISPVGLLLSILGMVLVVVLPLSNDVGRLIGYYLTQASPTVFVALLSLIATNVARYTKKTTVPTIFLIAYCAGNFIGPQTFRPRDQPRYVPADVYSAGSHCKGTHLIRNHHHLLLGCMLV